MIVESVGDVKFLEKHGCKLVATLSNGNVTVIAAPSVTLAQRWNSASLSKPMGDKS